MKGFVTHGPYELRVSLLDGGMLIRRLDDDGRRRTVAMVDTLHHWDRFVAALEAGATEVAAVHAIDASVPA